VGCRRDVGAVGQAEGVISLDSPVTAVLGRNAKKNKAITGTLGIETVGDLLRHVPRRYVETGSLTRLDDLRRGQLLTVVGDVARSKVHPFLDKRTRKQVARLEVRLATDGPSLSMTFFAPNVGMAHHWERELAPGTRGVFTGVAGTFRGDWQLTNPKYLLLTGADDGAPEALPDLYPIYPLTKGVDSWDLHRAVTFALGQVEPPADLVPAAVREAYDVVPARTAYAWIHNPDSHAQVTRARRHFRFEEALVTQLVLARRRRAQRALGARPRDGGSGELLAAFDDRLPFTLTEGQRVSGSEIEADLARDHPMNRLLQGEVGSGKTLVALRAMLRVVDSGGQAALLAPTEVLAQQHHRSLTGMLGDLAAGGMLGGAAAGTQVELLTGSMRKAQRSGPLSRLITGEAGIVVGTHALLEDTVMFADLGLVVVDEQHRFGVEQRAALTDKGRTPPHVLVMTATPIPRTVAMTVFGDLEVSTLRELPAGRAPIQTSEVDLVDHPSWLERVWTRVREEVERGHQVYVVCPRISGDQPEQGQTDAPEDSTVGDGTLDGAEGADERPGSGPGAPRVLAAVEDVLADLRAGPLAGLRVQPLHGGMDAEAKEATMRAFAGGEVDVLVATTVIEVGVDVHNATTMVVLDADRFGVSQLHQLRGRVGRGGLPGLCLLVSSADPGTPARERLAAVAATTDGFELSEVDLEQRREGDVLGRSQSGWQSSLASLRVLRDRATIEQAREAAEQLLETDPDLGAAPELAAAVTTLEQAAQGQFIEKS